jgi:hypothetical protein
MRYYEFTKPNDYALIANKINNVIRQLERVWKNAPREIPKSETEAKMALASAGR